MVFSLTAYKITHFLWNNLICSVFFHLLTLNPTSVHPVSPVAGTEKRCKNPATVWKILTTRKVEINICKRRFCGLERLFFLFFQSKKPVFDAKTVKVGTQNNMNDVTKQSRWEAHFDYLGCQNSLFRHRKLLCGSGKYVYHADSLTFTETSEIRLCTERKASRNFLRVSCGFGITRYCVFLRKETCRSRKSSLLKIYEILANI